MKPSNSAEKLKEFLASRGLDKSHVMTQQLVFNGIDFYKSVRCSGLAVNPQADMLLVQWGVYNWGKGEYFEFDLSRQFVSSAAFSDNAISQLRFTAYYSPTPILRSIKAENRWCESLAETASFERFIQSSAALNAVSSLSPSRVAIEWSPV